MKFITTTFFLALMLIFLGACNNKQTKKKNTQNNNTQKIRKPKKDENISTKKHVASEKIKREQEIDSLRMNLALKNAYAIARKNFHKKSFTKQYEFIPDDSSYVIVNEIIIGKLFGDANTYYLLRRTVPWGTHLNLYKIIDNDTINQINRMQDGMTFITYINDSIFDVNGDNYKDFVVHWYPNSGCCRRDVYNVYLNRPDKGIFTKDYEFMNPTFSAKEKIIRGIEYGHPGEVGLYKYKWNGLKVDTIEFIYPNTSKKGQFIKTTKPLYRPSSKDGIVLENLPEEYKHIESINWFLSY